MKFSIISLVDITDEQTVLTVEFEVKHSCEDKLTDFEINGSGLTDALTNAIVLNFVDASITIPPQHSGRMTIEENRVDPTCTVDGHYDCVVYCSICKTELSRQTKTLDKTGHSLILHEAKNATCLENGWNEYETCSRCDYTTYVRIPVIDHIYENGKCTMCGELDPDYLIGDVNGDGKVNIADIFMLKSVLLGNESNESCDVNGDGSINISDIFALKRILV